MKRIIILAVLLISGLYNLSFSQGKKKITYVSDNNNSSYYQVFVMDEDGSNKIQITDVIANCMHPKWSPDGTKIVFHTDDNRIFIVDNANTDKPSEPYFVFGGSNPIFESQGQQIFFNSDHDGILTIYIIDPEEKDAYAVSTLGYSNQQVLSRDGSKLVFSAFYEGNKSVMLIDLNDTTEDNTYQISMNDNANLVPDISSDNQLIVYAGFNNQLHGTIYINNNGKESALSKGITSANAPKFSPNDSKIAFLSIENTSVKLYVMNTDGSKKESYSIKGGNIGTYAWLDNDRIVYDAENGKEYVVGIIDIVSDKSSLLATDGNCLHPDVVKY